MMKNYLEMVQSVERDREALVFSDHVYTYGNLVDLASHFLASAKASKNC